MEILYTITETDPIGTYIFFCAAGIIVIAIGAIILATKDEVYGPGVLWIIGFLMFIISLYDITHAPVRTYVYAKIAQDVPYVEYIEKYEYVEHQDDVYKLRVVEKDDES